MSFDVGAAEYDRFTGRYPGPLAPRFAGRCSPHTPELVRPGSREVALHRVEPPGRLRVAIVVRHGFPRRFAPRIPFARINRSIRPRPTCSPARWSAFHIREEP